MFSLRAMEASSHIISELSLIREARLDCLLTLHVKDCPQSTGSLNLECAVRLVGMLEAAIPEVVVGNTI